METATKSRAPHLSDTQRLAWLRLIRSENVGPRTFRELLNHFGSAQAALDALPELSRRGGKKSYRLFSQDKAEAELAALYKIGARLIALGEPAYPTSPQTYRRAAAFVGCSGQRPAPAGAHRYAENSGHHRRPQLLRGWSQVCYPAGR